MAVQHTALRWRGPKIPCSLLAAPFLPWPPHLSSPPASVSPCLRVLIQQGIHIPCCLLARPLLSYARVYVPVHVQVRRQVMVSLAPPQQHSWSMLGPVGINVTRSLHLPHARRLLEGQVSRPAHIVPGSHFVPGSSILRFWLRMGLLNRTSRSMR
eukprot:364080-Chlamydomonas_euryale.AAC.8